MSEHQPERKILNKNRLKFQSRETQNDTLQIDDATTLKLQLSKEKQSAGENFEMVNKQKELETKEKKIKRLEWEKKLAGSVTKEDARDRKETLSKTDLKAKRREQQEAQRLAKTSKQKQDQRQLKPLRVIEKDQNKKNPWEIQQETKNYRQVHKVQLVHHLYVEDLYKSVLQSLTAHSEIHPVFIKLGIQYMNKTIIGSNARCLALLFAVKYLVEDLQTPPREEYLRYLEVVLQTCTNYLQNCRPFAVCMMNALRHFKMQIRQIDKTLISHTENKHSDNEKKVKLQEIIDTYIKDDIQKASDAISLKVNEKITNGDVILTYGCSSLIQKILLDAHKDGKQFEVIVVDGRPFLEGTEMLRRLVVTDIKCSYVLINAVSYIMSPVTKVILGAHALLTNGCVMSRIGTAQVALMAQAYNKPVLVCCETYKFSERVQTDSFVHNEVDDPEILTTTNIIEEPNTLSKWKNMNKFTPLNLLYDITPPDLVTAVVTELAILPCTSVPVVLRINANETV